MNEEGFITECIESVMQGNYPLSSLEVLVLDGGSTDQTRAEVEQLASKYPNIQLLNNAKKIVPSAVNIGLKSAQHELVIWLGAHAVYDPDYLVNSVQVLIEENCASSGGVIKPIAKTTVGQAIAAATRSKFGIGNARYRIAKKRETVDTVFGGCWRKSDILKIGGFDERWVRNQDYELNSRLRANIGEIILDPSIKCEYYCRETIPALARQYFHYGYWRFRTALQHPNSLGIRQFAPLLLLTGLLVSLLLAVQGSLLALVVPASYLIPSLIMSTILAISHRRLGYLVLLPVIFATLHLSWATGFTVSGATYIFNRDSQT